MVYINITTVECSWKRIKYLYLMSHISGSSCLFYAMHIPLPSLKSTVKVKTDDSLWEKTPCGNIKLSVWLLTGLAWPLCSTEPERAVLPWAAQGWPKGRRGLSNKAWQPRRVTSRVLACTLWSQRPPQRQNLKYFFRVKGPVLPG